MNRKNGLPVSASPSPADGGVLLVDPAEDPRWDRFVETHPFGKIGHLSGWKKVLEGTFRNLAGYYLALLDKSENEIQAALPVFLCRNILGCKRLSSIPFATLCDPLVSSSQQMDVLLSAALRLMEMEGASFIEVRTLDSASLMPEARLCRHNFLKYHYLPLEREPAELRKTFHRSCVRQRIARAEQSDVKLRIGQQETDLKEFYRLYSLTRRRLGLPPHPFNFFVNIWREFHPQDRVNLFFAERGSEIIGTQLLFKFRDRVSAEFIGWNNTARDLSPNHFLFWQAISMAYNEGYELFDFGATSPENTSLMDFKGHWGTTVIDIPFYYYPLTMCGYYESQKSSGIYKIARAILPNLPRGLLQAAGDFYYRHLA